MERHTKPLIQVIIIKNKLNALLSCLLVLGLCLPLTIRGQSSTDSLAINTMIQPLTEAGIFRDPDFFNWGGSIIKDEHGDYHLFYSRWNRTYTFAGWLTFSEIARASAKSAFGPWTYQETVLKGKGKGHWDAITAHNPKIKYFGGKYYLYYISTHLGAQEYDEQTLIATNDKSLNDSNRRFLREQQRTGVAVSNSIHGPWVRSDSPLIEPSGPIVTLTVNPAIAEGKDGKYYLIIKGDKPNETGFIRNQAIAVANDPAGPFSMQPHPVIGDLDTEDVSMWYDRNTNRFYAIFHAHTFIGLMTSEDGLHWAKARNYKVMDKKILLRDVNLLIPDRMERPFVYVENGEPKILCLAVKKGEDSYSVFVPLKASE